mmetsp:Transcript_18528/g.34961  ORF Transcript_18528/g.34961 Transcript_18528/m.34961 type:complete len:315 (-) Transcript_18528:275-1219(-)
MSRLQAACRTKWDDTEAVEEAEKKLVIKRDLGSLQMLHSRILLAASMTAQELAQPVDSFRDMGLKQSILDGLSEAGFEAPFEFQRRCIRPIASGYDVIGVAKTGGGKRTACILGVYQNIRASEHGTQALFVAPVRELAFQAKTIAWRLCGGLKAAELAPSRALAAYIETANEKQSSALRMSSFAFVGGTPLRRSIEVLRRGVKVLFGTPGRLYDLMRRGRALLKPEAIHTVVLDEADRLVEFGFDETVSDLLRALPSKGHRVQFCMLSASASGAQAAERAWGPHSFFRAGDRGSSNLVRVFPEDSADAGKTAGH